MSSLKLLKVKLLASPGDFEARQMCYAGKSRREIFQRVANRTAFFFFTVVSSICCCHLRLGWIYTHKRCEKAFEDPVAVSLKACRMYNRIPVRIRSERCVHAEVVARDIKPRLFISQNWSFEARLKGRARCVNSQSSQGHAGSLSFRRVIVSALHRHTTGYEAFHTGLGHRSCWCALCSSLELPYQPVPSVHCMWFEGPGCEVQ